MPGEKLVKIMQKASKKAIDNTNLSDTLYGTITSISPLRLKVDNRFEVGEDFLILSPFCFKNEVEVKFELDEEEVKTQVLIWDGLNINDKVLLLRCQSGQRYYVMNKV